MSFLNSLSGRAARTGLKLVDRKRLPRTSGTQALPGLNRPAEVLRDRWGVPHLYAETDHDLYLVQGYVHAQDRLWQMELLRRLSGGRLSELFGELSLDTDRTTRTFGFARLGRADLDRAAPEIAGALAAYAQGVNAYIESDAYRRERPIEFSLLRHQPEPWTPEDSVAISRLMLWQLSHAWYGEIVRAQVIEKVGAERAAEIDVRYPSENPIVLPHGIEFNLLRPGGILEAVQGPFLSRGLGSNAWAVSGSHTETGSPMLCNDMHLGLSTPGLWYLAHHQTSSLRVTGATLPGLPLVLVGHNARIAWGATLAFTDCEDLFVERFAPESTQYEFGEEWREAQIIDETIRVKGRDAPHTEHVVVTHHGPVISDVVGQPETRLAVQSMSLQPSHALLGWWRLNRATGWDDFVDAMACIDATQLNVTYADTEGNIGYWVTGKVPIRASSDGTVPAAGWTGDAEWVGIVPVKEMPHALNPSAGYLVNCNNRIVDDSYPYYLGNAWMNGYRARRVATMIAGTVPFTPDDARDVQMDVISVAAGDLLDRLADVAPRNAQSRASLDELRSWDGRLTTDSAAGTLYEVLRVTLMQNLLEPALGRELTLRWMGQGFHPLLLSASELHGYDFVALLRLLDQPDSWWVQQAGGRDAWIERSLVESIEWLRRKLGPNRTRWTWGRIHRAHFPHALGAGAPLDVALGLGPYPVGGDNDTPCQTSLRAGQYYDLQGAAATFREIVDLSDLSRSLVMVPPGQSGHLASPHYSDMVQPWLAGEYIPMLWTRAQVETNLEGKLRLEPVPSA